MVDNPVYTPVKEIQNLVKEARSYFKENKTKSYEWRIQQLQLLEKCVVENSKEVFVL